MNFIEASIVDRPGKSPVSPFSATLRRHGVNLRRQATHTLQINVGYRCTLSCRHCHLECGPHRTEVMSPGTMRQVVEYARRGGFRSIDVTGGSPELTPGISGFVEELSRLAPQLILRTNLMAPGPLGGGDFWELCRELAVVLVTSLPAASREMTEAQRGRGSWQRILDGIRRLNASGYGMPGSGLELHLVSNPIGASLPAHQARSEEMFRRILGHHGLWFTRLLAFANAPLGRFDQWLAASGTRASYIEKLAETFNPDAVANLMCRSLVSVDWQGYLHDCDFNLAAGIPLGGRTTHVSTTKGAPPAGSAIATGEHCYACTAKAGFT